MCSATCYGFRPINTSLEESRLVIGDRFSRCGDNSISWWQLVFETTIHVLSLRTFALAFIISSVSLCLQFTGLKMSKIREIGFMVNQLCWMIRLHRFCGELLLGMWICANPNQRKVNENRTRQTVSSTAHNKSSAFNNRKANLFNFKWFIFYFQRTRTCSAIWSFCFSGLSASESRYRQTAPVVHPCVCERPPPGKSCTAVKHLVGKKQERKTSPYILKRNLSFKAHARICSQLAKRRKLLAGKYRREVVLRKNVKNEKQTSISTSPSPV